MRHVHFVGSIGLNTVENVLTTTARKVGPYLRRCPDGEPGGRLLWIGWQYAVLRANLDLRVDLEKQCGGGVGMCQLYLAPGVNPAEVHFGELGYAREAWASYQQFLNVRARGDFSPGTRFQVCLPTPMAVVGAFVRQSDIPKVLPAYQAAMIREVAQLCQLIPHHDLAIQWDVCIEMIMWDGRFPQIPAPPHLKPMIQSSFQMICAGVPDEVELGVHLCYGDLDSAHFVDPMDLANAVSLGNYIMDAVPHPLAWLHMPVPANRDDAAYFAPLKDLRLDPGCELFLGLVHDDSIDAIRRRMSAAQTAVKQFGVATECGIGRLRSQQVVEKLLDLHAQAAAS